VFWISADDLLCVATINTYTISRGFESESASEDCDYDSKATSAFILALYRRERLATFRGEAKQLPKCQLKGSESD
jgi:hypothetical protein